MSERPEINIMSKEEVAAILLDALCALDAMDFIERAEQRLRESESAALQEKADALAEDQEHLRRAAYDAVHEARRIIRNSCRIAWPLLDILRDLDALFDFGKPWVAGDEVVFERTRRVNECFAKAHTWLKRLQDVETESYTP